MAWCSLDGK
uniref:Uncharacterized protein n=1 Tax=Arundo donax TaxID=35708 RepID=A0A0A9F1D4_ARUDO